MPMRRGSAGSGRLRAGVEQPFGLQPLLQLLERELQRAEPVRLQVLADELVFALRLVDAEPAARDDVQAVLGLEPQVAHASVRNITALICAPPSLSVKYMCPVFHTLAVRDLAFDPDLAEPLLEQRCGSPP